MQEPKSKTSGLHPAINYKHEIDAKMGLFSKSSFLHHLFSLENLADLKLVLKEIIDQNIDRINQSVNWSAEELNKLAVIKNRREQEKHNRRFSK